MGAMKDVFMDRCQDWADYLNGFYGLEVIGMEIEAIAIDDEFFMKEIEDESYTDTMPREMMANSIAQERIGMSMPCYGHDEEYKKEFKEKMSQWFEENRSRV